MNFLNRFQGIFFNPQMTFKSLSAKPIWIDALILLLIAIMVFTYFVQPYSQQDNLKLTKNNLRLKERMGEERFNQMIERLENPSKISLFLRPFLMAPVTLLVGFLLSSLILLGLGRFLSTEGNYLQLFSAYLHANFIDKVFGNGLRLVLILSRRSVVQTTTSLALLFPRLEVTSPGFIILSQFDFFQLWMFGIFGYALSNIFKIELKKALFVSYGFWLIKSLFYITLAFISLRYMR
ncbi:MAG: YIP1 family protein [Candidatus Aminicenantales bacterium]